MLPHVSLQMYYIIIYYSYRLSRTEDLLVSSNRMEQDRDEANDEDTPTASQEQHVRVY